MSDQDLLAEIKAWWAAFDAGGWRDPKVEPLVQARTYIDWLVGEVERLREPPEGYRDEQGRLLYCPSCGANAPEGYPHEVLYGSPDPEMPNDPPRSEEQGGSQVSPP